MIWTKFQIFDCSREISNLYSDWLLLLKVYIKLHLKKYGGIMSHDIEE